MEDKMLSAEEIAAIEQRATKSLAGQWEEGDSPPCTDCQGLLSHIRALEAERDELKAVAVEGEKFVGWHYFTKINAGTPQQYMECLCCGANTLNPEREMRHKEDCLWSRLRRIRQEEESAV